MRFLKKKKKKKKSFFIIFFFFPYTLLLSVLISLIPDLEVFQFPFFFNFVGRKSRMQCNIGSTRGSDGINSGSRTSVQKLV